MFALVKKKITKNSMEYKSDYEQYLRNESRFRKLRSTLVFDANTTMFTPESAKNVSWRYDSPMANAFYTDEIHVKGGPESFNGLPGMILGVSVPHENVTWFATKLAEKIV